MTLGWRALVLAVLALSGCSPREACSRDDSPTPLESSSFTGTRVLTSQGEREELDVELTLTGLPELWAPDGAVEGGRLAVLLGFAYDGVPANGTVEMPRIGVSFEHAEGGGASERYPGASGFLAYGFTFPICVSPEDRGCCEFGSESCAIHDTVALERLDGAPFPPLEVSWQVDATASINDCPFGEANPELELAVATP